MTVHQISLFLENKPGRLAAICRTLTESGVNIASLSLADTTDEFFEVDLFAAGECTLEDIFLTGGGEVQ